MKYDFYEGKSCRQFVIDYDERCIYSMVDSFDTDERTKDFKRIIYE